MPDPLDRISLVIEGRSVGRAGLHLRAAEQLRRAIIRCELAPGTAISEAKLCVDMGLSRTPLREALKLLSAEGLIELRPNRSPLVRPMRPDDVAHLFETVAGVERLAAEWAAARLSGPALRKLAGLQDRMEAHHAAGQIHPYFELNDQIHRAIVAGAANPVLVQTHAGLIARAERARFAALGAQGRWKESVEEHRAVLRALQDRDGGAAGRLLLRHVQRTGEVVAEALRAAGRRAA